MKPFERLGIHLNVTELGAIVSMIHEYEQLEQGEDDYSVLLGTMIMELEGRLHAGCKQKFNMSDADCMIVDVIAKGGLDFELSASESVALLSVWKKLELQGGIISLRHSLIMRKVATIQLLFLSRMEDPNEMKFHRFTHFPN
jgi:hypothetical protein